MVKNPAGFRMLKNVAGRTMSDNKVSDGKDQNQIIKNNSGRNPWET